ncbi:M23 family metallopeptidase [Haloglycomyces albus]|uniref:M23 family metallopeptidase n=1 Tax=Haloglycomyces albus TaxID=526067 RepID=UPI000688D928|nr:M23 family metallopeptidase [Haloglycomyces albus]
MRRTITFFITVVLAGVTAIAALFGQPSQHPARADGPIRDHDSQSETEQTVTSDWLAPTTEGNAITRDFHPPPQPWQPGHRGIDLAVSAGAVVRASGDGVVSYSGRVADRGVVSIIHDNGLRTTYEPVNPVVDDGERVSAGDEVGRVTPGHGGPGSAVVLHFGVRSDEEYLDPLALWGQGSVRLLPTRTEVAES